jgi:hypothetical protein
VRFASASSCTAREQQWPTTTGASKPVSSTVSAIIRSVATDGSRLVDVEVGVEAARGAMRKKARSFSFRSGIG